MGQSASEQCKCVGFCGPEEPGVEERTQIETQTGQAYPQTLGEQGLDSSLRQQPEAARHGADSAHSHGTNGVSAGFGDVGQDDVLGFLPPPPARGGNDDFSGAMPPPAPARGGSSPTRAASGGSPARGDGGVTGGATASLDDILSDLEGAEQKVYSGVFNGFGGGGSGPGFVGMDNAKCRDFILARTAVSRDEVDVEILKEASATMDDGLSLQGFLSIMLNHAINEADPISAFLQNSNDGETVSSMECRNCLLLHCQQKLNVNFTEDRFDAIFTMVMMSAGVSVKMEEYVAYCRRTARIVRLIELCGH